MAKKENIRDDGGLLGGLSFGESKRAAQEAPATRPAPATPVVSAPQKVPVSQVLTRSYRDSREEKRRVRYSFLITPTTNRLLDEAVKRGEIKSKNHLVNYLLEQYLGVDD